MKKTVLLFLFVIFSVVLPAAAQTGEELSGTWIAFYWEDMNEFSFLRFSPDGSHLSKIECEGYYYTSYSGTYQADGETITYTQPDWEYEEEFPYYFSEGKLILDWYGEHAYSRIDDRYFPENLDESPFIGEEKEYWISMLEDETIQINGYVGTKDAVEVPRSVFGYPVTAVGNSAFSFDDSLKRVVLPHGITSIGDQAFDNDHGLQSIELPDTLVSIGYCAFEFCSGLKEIVIPEGVTFLDTDTFFGCENLMRVTLPESLETIDEWAFDSETKESGVFIVKEGSYAQQFCQEHGLKWTASDGKNIAAADERETVEVTRDSLRLDTLLKSANNDKLLRFEGRAAGLWDGKLVFAAFDKDGAQLENSFKAAQTGEDFYGIPAERLAETLGEADNVILVQNRTEPWGDKTWNFAQVYHIDWPASFLLEESQTDADYVPPAGSKYDPARYYILMKAEDLAYEAAFAGSDEFSGEPDLLISEEPEPETAYSPEGDEDLYNEAMALYRDEKYYSARKAFLSSGYGDYEEMAEKCIQSWPADGEIWRDRSQWLQDMELTIVIDQPEDTAMFIRIYKDDAPVSYLFISGPDSVTTMLPGNAYYVIKDGVGRTWYGTKEAFGREGSYETMTFDEYGTESVYLQSYYAYTLSINVDASNPDADDVFTEQEDWENFIEE